MGAPAKLTVGDTEVTRIGLGTNRLTDSPEGAAFIRAAVAAGIEHIDTAHLYTGGASERAIGAALSPLSAGCVVATKGGYGGAGHGRPEALRAEIEESLRSLRTEAIPLYYRCAATSRRRWPRSPSGTARPGARSRSPGCCAGRR